jgi:3-methyladenine DNA glycosylase/8-oxoguanine DNA glycosylase
VKRFSIAVPPDFDFRATVWSHGWCFLEPFRSRDEGRILERPLRLARGRVTRVETRQPSGRGAPLEVQVTGGAGSRGGLAARDRATVETALRRMLRLDEDLADFHALCRAAGPLFAGAPAAGFGRLLRSPTLFEDMVKVLATTNTAWSGTRAMVARLVALGGGRAFPTPAEIAALGADRLRREGRWGYRAEYLAALAGRVDSGDLDLGTWERWDGSTEDLEGAIRSLPGFGPYAAGHVLALLGRYDRIGVDTDFRSFVRRRHFPRARKAPSPRRMLAVYDRWGSWRFLAYWWELWSESYAAGEILQAAESA